ncbi:hypothetical protein ACYX78_13365 [Advenella incenata]
MVLLIHLTHESDDLASDWFGGLALLIFEYTPLLMLYEIATIDIYE